MKSKTVLAVLLAMVLVAVAVASAAAASPSQTIATDTPTATLAGTGTPAPSGTPSPVPTTNPCAASSGGTSTGGTPTVGGTTGGTTSSEGDTSTGSSGGQPVASALCNFFNSNLGITYSDIITLHSDGFGFGEIAQACWMALVLQTNNTSGGSTPTCQDILNAKQGNNIGSLNLGGATNWGQLKKFVLGMHHGFNLGAVVSGRAVGLFNGTSLPGNGHGHGQGNGGGNGNGQGNGQGNGNGHRP